MTCLSLFLRLVAIFGLVFALSHCTSPAGTAASGGAQPGASVNDGASGSSQTVQDLHSSKASAASALPSADASTVFTASQAEYRIGARDSLQITVYQVPDLSAKGVLVDAGGNIVMPLIGSVHVGGLTTHEAAKVIADKLGKTYLQHPQVFVILQTSAKRVIVAGAVVKPTAVPSTGGLTLSQAVVAAGGLSDVANPERVHVARVSGHRVRDAVFNLDAILAGRAPDPSVYGGDMIVAEDSGSKVAFKTVKDLLPFSALAGLIAGF